MKLKLKKNIRVYDLKDGKEYILLQGSIVDVDNAQNNFVKKFNELPTKTKQTLQTNARILLQNIINDPRNNPVKKLLNNLFSSYNIDLFNLPWRAVSNIFSDMPVVVLCDQTNRRNLVVDYNLLVYEPTNFLEIKFGGAFLEHLFLCCFEEIFESSRCKYNKYKYQESTQPFFNFSAAGCFFGFTSTDNSGKKTINKKQGPVNLMFNRFTSFAQIYDSLARSKNK